MSDIATMAAAYRRLQAEYEQVHELPKGAESARNSVWTGISQLATAIMCCPPQNLGDIAIQLGIAASWMDSVREALANEHDEQFFQGLAEGIATATANATILLCRSQEELPVQGEALDLLNDLYAEAVRSDAQTMKVAA